MKKNEVLREMRNVYESISEKAKNATGYVVAGYATNGVYYAYVGEGAGYQGSALSPSPYYPITFSDEKAANRVALNGRYFNGAAKEINLRATAART